MRRSWHSFSGAVAGILLGLPCVAQAQISFYTAPVPMGYSTQGVGNNETGTATSEELGESEGGGGLGGIFARKPFVLTLSVRQGYDSNVFTTPDDPIDSWYTNWAAGIAYAFGGSRLQLSANLGGGITYYYQRPGDKVDFNGVLGLNATYLATPRLTLAFNTSTAYLSQPDLTIVGGTNRQDGDYFYTNTTISAAYQWSELISTVTSYNFSAFYYVDQNLNENQGRISQTVAQSVRWLWKPKTTLIAEYRINPVTYFDADLNQLSNFFLLGFDQVFNPRFFWNVRVGAQVNFNNNPVDGQSTYVGPYMESILTYAVGKSTSLSWNMRYGTEASGLNDVTQRQTFRTGLVLNHSFTPRIAATFAMNYQCNYYDQANVIPTFTENIVDFSAGLTFRVNRWVSLQAGYQFTIDIAPEYTGRDYTRNIVFAGANFTF
jgi:hypothetical protein